MKTAVRKSPGAMQTWPLPWVLQSRERSGSGCNKSMLEILCPSFLLITVSSCKWNNPQENRSHPCHVTEEEVNTHLANEHWEPTEQLSRGAEHADKWEFRLKADPCASCSMAPCVITWMAPQVLSAVTPPPFGVNPVLLFSKGHLFTASHGSGSAQIPLVFTHWPSAQGCTLFLSRKVGAHNQFATQGGI